MALGFGSIEVFDEKNTKKKRISLVMDLVTGGELFDSIVARGSYTEKDAIEVQPNSTRGTRLAPPRAIFVRKLVLSAPQCAAFRRHLRVRPSACGR
jgi:hypothetical protein